MSHDDCPTGIVKNGVCNPRAALCRSSSTPGAYFTTWSSFGAVAGVAGVAAFALGALPCTPLRSSKLFRYAVLPASAMLLVNSVIVNVVAHFLMAYNFKLIVDDERETNHSLTTGYFRQLAKSDFRNHVMPSVVGVFGLAGLLLVNTLAPKLWLNPWLMTLLCVVWQCVFVGAYLIVPSCDINGRCLMGFNKTQSVYNNPSPWIWVGTAAASITLLGLVGCQLA
jgi:hypothetical protein